MNPSKAKKEMQRKGAAYERLFTTPDGEFVLADLKREFDASALKKNREGMIDPHASIAAAGSREVLLHIDMMRKKNAITTGDS